MNAATLRQKLPELDSPLEEPGLCRAFLLSLAIGRLILRCPESKRGSCRGGDYVPEADVRRRFDRFIKNFLELYRPLGDSWYLFLTKLI